jgi:2',3'-cyclic-nucleotide 2'-phosphodiesterase (5'-nucleotidase family)
MRRLIILHTNDIHGRIEGLARVASLVERVRAENPDIPVLYFDAGDSEETTVRLSSLTKGTAMHRLLGTAGCDAAAVGNGAILRYGDAVLADHVAAAGYPLLLANMRLPDGSPVAGVQPAALLDLGFMRLGLIGVTSDMEGMYQQWFGLKMLDPLPLIQELAAALRQDGAGDVILLSHMGLSIDRALAPGLQGVVTAIIGAHTHDLLVEGERHGDVLVAQAGEYAKHLGRIDMAWDGERLAVLRATVLPVADDLPPAPPVLAEVAAVEDEVARFLDEIVGELAAPLDFAADRECGVANLGADMLRQRMGAEVGLVAAGQAFSGPLPGGPLHRMALWEVCGSPANPGVTRLTGAQLTALVARGLDPAFADDRPRMLRGQPRGLLHMSGATIKGGQLLVDGRQVDPERAYLVAATDWELESYGGYVEPEWELAKRYDVPIIMREALEEYLAGRGPVAVEMRRLEGALEELMTKTKLLDTLRSRRAEWDALLESVPIERMAEPGVAGEWSVRDIVAHLTYYERWIADRLHEQLRGERYMPTELDMMGEARNDIIVQRTRNQPPAEVLEASRQAFEHLVAGVRAHAESFLTEPQQFEGAPQPVLVWRLLQGDVYDHYRLHIPSIQRWLASSAAAPQEH